LGKGIIKISKSIVAYWFVSGKRHDDIKELLKLPEQYQVEDVAMDWQHGGLLIAGNCVDITVSAPEILVVPEGQELPLIEPVYVSSDFVSYEGDTHERVAWSNPDRYLLGDLKIHPRKGRVA